mmetsp:Transcript_124/g.90  ORF Transcript_124/g.90 Transcript_124/m.90 type:complete len:364 (-) Transcript_124:170-1261(-)
MSEAPKSSLQSLIYKNDEGGPSLSVLDQLLVPKSKEYLPIKTVEDAWAVIVSMQIRGAPLIAIVACLGLAVDLSANPPSDEKVEEILKQKIDYLKTSRPTAVNLFNALAELMASVQGMNTSKETIGAVVDYAEFMLKRDVSDNEAIGSHGADMLLKSKETIRLMTICNTGSLATAGYGTALGVARALHSRGKLESITALETRPYNQGSRLTAFEIVEEGMPGTKQLICDGAAAAMMKINGIDACVVGADRVCANGDTANKIGTYNLSLIAAAHKVPFYVASPFTTLDVNLPTGDSIPIEERPAAEMIGSGSAPENIKVWNPAFDVTPNKYINGIITEKGVICDRTSDGSLDIVSFVKNHSTAQ